MLALHQCCRSVDRDVWPADPNLARGFWALLRIAERMLVASIFSYEEKGRHVAG